MITKLINSFLKALSMELPNDPNILVSILNMKLRDGDYESLDELFDTMDLNKERVLEILSKAGFEYMDSIRQFR